jgi:hypothetical protein
MATKYVAIGGDPSFGCDGAELKINGTGPSIGLLQSCDGDSQYNEWIGKDSNGRTARQVLFDENGTLNCSFFIDNGIELPVKGDSLEVGGEIGSIQTIKTAWKNDSGTQVDISAKWYASLDATQVTIVTDDAAAG